MVDTAAPQRTPEERQKLLQDWYVAAEDLRKLRATEILMRKAVVHEFFEGDLPEGTSRADIGGGFDLKASQSFTRDVDEAALDANKERLVELEVSIDDLFKYRPSLVKRVYNKLTDEQLEVVEDCLTTKPGTPSLSIEKNAEAKKAEEDAEPDPDTDAIPF